MPLFRYNQDAITEYQVKVSEELRPLLRDVNDFAQAMSLSNNSLVDDEESLKTLNSIFADIKTCKTQLHELRQASVIEFIDNVIRYHIELLKKNEGPESFRAGAYENFIRNDGYPAQHGSLNSLPTLNQ